MAAWRRVPQTLPAAVQACEGAAIAALQLINRECPGKRDGQRQ